MENSPGNGRTSRFLMSFSPILKTFLRAGFCLLLFLSIIPLGSSHPWFEAASACTIFFLTAAWLTFGESMQTPKYVKGIALPILALAAFSIIHGVFTLIAAHDVGASIALLPSSFDPIRSIWVGVKLTAFVCFLILAMCIFRDNRLILALALVIVGDCFAAFGIFRDLFQSSHPNAFTGFLPVELVAGVGYGTFFNKNHFAFLMLMAFGVNLGLVYRNTGKQWIRIFCAASALLTGTALVMAGSRAAIFSMFCEIILLFIFSAVLFKSVKSTPKDIHGKPKAKRIIRNAAICLLAVGFTTIGIFMIGDDLLFDRLGRLPQEAMFSEDSASYKRADVWKAAIKVFAEQPLFGVGFGGFSIAAPKHLDISGNLVPSQAHNDYLELVTSGGIVGAALFLWFVYVFFSRMVHVARKDVSRLSGAIRFGALIGISGAIIHSFVDYGAQFFSNQLLLGGLIALAVMELANNAAAVSTEVQPKNGGRITIAIAILFLAAVSAIFGYSRYAINNAAWSSSTDSIDSWKFRFPFDSEANDIRASLQMKAGKYDDAATSLTTAIKYKSNDYELWLRLGDAEFARKDMQGAESSYLKAIELAPHFGKPHFQLGTFLLTTGRQAEAVDKLRIASRRDSSLFDEVLRIVSTEIERSPAKIIERMKPFNEFELWRTSRFFMDRREFDAIAQLNCAEDGLTGEKRAGIVIELLERGKVRNASQVEYRNCGSLVDTDPLLKEESFEEGLVRTGTGFGWRIADRNANARISFDSDSPVSNGQSLRLDFNGDTGSFFPISQVFAIKPGRNYVIGFAYKTNDIVTGGLPIIQIIRRDADSQVLATEITLLPNSGNWTHASVSVESDSTTEALEIRLSRKTCPQGICPIFGTIWMDDFSIAVKP
ncbi:MAG: O-antigen ligase family protein [Blastocatellia bacterium]